MQIEPDSITRFSIFNSLTSLEAGVISRSAYRRLYKSGERVVNESDAAVGIYLIESGSVRIYKSVRNEFIELATLSSGAFFGELTLLQERPRTATVISAEPTSLLCLFRPEFLEILNNYPAICSKFLPSFSSVLIERVRNMYSELEKLRG